MIMNAYSIFDMKALQYHLPFFQPADGAAIRMLLDLVNDPNTMVGRHPSDYVLYHVGHYDDSIGGILPCAPLRHIVDAVSLVRVQPPLPLDIPLRMDPDKFQQALNGEAK